MTTQNSKHNTQFIKHKRRTYVFIDATNIIYGATGCSFRVDFRKLIKYLRERFESNKVYYYGGIDKENIKQLNFYNKLRSLGFELRLVPVKVFSNGKKKADVDSRMTFEMMLYFNMYDRLVVLTGDGDFYWVLEYLKKEKEKLWILSFPKQSAKELKILAGADFANLENIKERIKWTKK
jgi:uncharacterized LabA/DUF88 family protein